MGDRVLNRREMIALEMAYATHAKASGMDDLESVMKEKKVYARYRSALVMMENALRAVIDTLNDRQKRHMQDIHDHYMVGIMPIPVTAQKHTEHYIRSEDLQVLLDCSQRDQCAMCFKEGKECRKCRLRQIYLEYAPLEEFHDKDTVCEYAKLNLPEVNLDER